MPHLNLLALKDVHNSANNLLHLNQYAALEASVHELSEASLWMLDACSATQEVLSVSKHHLRDLQSAFRRTSISKSSSAGVENVLAAYNLHKKKVKKEMLGCLKGMKRKHLDVSTVDHSLGAVVKVLREVRVATISIMESLLSLMSTPGPLNKNFSNGPFAIYKFSRKCDTLSLRSANKRLEVVGIAIEGLEIELECMFRHLIQTRVLLLNILTTS